jgi:hypothetical protein
MTALERAQRLGLDDLRGIAYKPGPLAIDGSQNPQKEGGAYFENIQDGLDVQYTIYYDSDFYNSDFDQLWSGSNGGRDDLRRFQEQLNVNFVHTIRLERRHTTRGTRRRQDARPHPVPGLRQQPGHQGHHSDLELSDEERLLHGDTALAQQNAQNMFNEIYGATGTTPHPAAGLLKIFNEPDASECANVRLVADACVIWKTLEDARGVPDENRLPITFPVTFGISNGIPGGGMLPAWQAIRDNGQLGGTFWSDRIIYATNPFNDGDFMKAWLTQTAPAWFAQNGIPQRRRSCSPSTAEAATSPIRTMMRARRVGRRSVCRGVAQAAGTVPGRLPIRVQHAVLEGAARAEFYRDGLRNQQGWDQPMAAARRGLPDRSEILEPQRQ